MLQFVGNVEYALDKLKSAKEIKNGVIPTVPVVPTAITNPNRSVYAQSQVVYTQPQFYSPLHTPQNWQIPVRRRDQYQWIRHWVDNDGKVAGAIDFYSNFPVNGFETVCPDAAVKRYFDNLNKKLNLDQWCKLISREFHMLGDVFPFLEVQCDTCHGSGLRPDGDYCDHKGGTFRRLVVLNPDTVEVQKSSLVEDPVVTLLPDEELRRVVWNRKPKEIFDRLPIHIRQLVVANKPIPLAPECVSHLKYNAGPYQTYGTSIIRRLFRILAYKDKLLTAQWIIAERLILPIRVVKVGDADRPASNTDLSAIQQQLAQVANDPNLTLVTHHAFDYEWYGASGKVMPLSNEYELINKEMLQGLMLNEALLSGEMAGYACHDDKTRVLTQNGFKNFDDLTEEDKIACFNKETGGLEYHKPLAKHSYDFDGNLVHFQTDRIDIAVTPNHKMLFQSRYSDEWQVGEASTVGARSRFKKNVKWEGNKDYPKVIHIPAVGNSESDDIPLNDYLELAALYVTEGHIQHETRKSRSTYQQPSSVSISQSSKGKAWKTVLNLKDRTHLNMAHYPRDCGDNFLIHRRSIACHFEKEFGHGSYNKRLPIWIKNLPAELLKKFLMDMINGDGCWNKRLHNDGSKYYCYNTVSNQLKDDVVEIALKCGYYPKFVYRKRTNKGKPKNGWIVYFSDSDLQSDNIPLTSRKYKEITKMPYKGKVWCLTVPTGFIITERNGRIAIQGNSAAIGVECIIQRLEAWRLELARWIEDKIYRQVAKMRGFIDKQASEELGEEVYIIPKIQWNDLNLRDDTQQKQLWLQLFDKQLISAQSLSEKFGLDYDYEVERKRLESAMQTMSQGGGGAMMGGAPPGDGMGAPPGGDMGGMGAPPPGGDMGGMGAPPPAGGDMGGMGAPAPAGPMAGLGTASKIMRRGKRKTTVPEEEEVEPVGINLTSLEQIMYQIMMGINVPFQKWIQYPLGPYKADFAIPQIKLAVECDGYKWHSTADAIAHDKKRDMELAKYGWTTIRFSEFELKENKEAIKKTIIGNIYRLWQKALEQQKKLNAKNKQVNAQLKELAVKNGFSEDQIISEGCRTSAEINEEISEPESEEVKAGE